MVSKPLIFVKCFVVLYGIKLRHPWWPVLWLVIVIVPS